MLIAYARVSTHEQNLDLQLDAFTKAGCDPKYTYTDKISTSKPSTARDGLEQAMNQLREGDTLVVWRLDRLGRTLKELIELITDLGNKGIGFKSLTENIDTTTPGGMLIFHIFGALAQFEREIIKERTNAGLQAARARGRLGGRPKALDDPKKLAQMFALYDAKKDSVDAIIETFGISRATFYKYLGAREKR
jgi:DNA invertase Pin-like site-specific DNA recombinase